MKKLVPLISLLPSLAVAGGFQRLYAESATASSFLKSNWNKYEENYHPSYALDDDPKTAWVEGAEGVGIGEKLTIPVSALKSARAVRLVIFNGYQKSKALLAANGAPKEVTIRILGPSGKESARKQLTLEKKMGPQQFDLPVTAGVGQVLLQIDSVHPGKVYNDTCLSDLQVFVDSDVPYLKAVEDGKKKALAAWKRDRLDNAKYFASLPPEFPWASNKFAATNEQTRVTAHWQSVTSRPDDVAIGAAAKDYVELSAQLAKGKVPGGLAEADQKLVLELNKLARAGVPKTGRFYQVETKAREHLPDGVPLAEKLATLATLATLVHLGDATLFEAKGFGSVAPVIQDNDMGFGHAESLSNVLLLDGTATDPKKVLLGHVVVTADRTTTTETTWLLAELAGGRLQRLATQASVDDDYLKSLTVGVVHRVWEDEKVRAIDSEVVADRSEVIGGPSLESDGIWVEKIRALAAPRS